MDNIGLFDRSAPLPPGWRLEQSDATRWMAFYCLQMLQIALELGAARPRVGRPGHEVPRALPRHRRGDERASARTRCRLWDEEDGFFYDVLVAPDGETEPLRVRSMVGLLPLLRRDRDARRGSTDELPDVHEPLRVAAASTARS